MAEFSMLHLSFQSGVRRPGRAPRWLPAVLAVGTIVSVAADSPPVRLTDDGNLKRDPCFTADGHAIVFSVQDRRDRYRLMKLDLQTRKAEPLHPQAAASEFEPAFAPDGSLLAFIQGRGNLSLALVIQQWPSGTQWDLPPAGGFSGYRSPAFSHDGRRVFFAFPEGGRQHIFSVTTRATDRKQITDTQGVTNWPNPTPDGRGLIVASTREGNYDLYRFEFDTGRFDRLTDFPGQDIRPRLSPDGRWIAFVRNDGNYDVFVMPAHGGTPRSITDHPERDDYPAWSPDGRHLVMVCERRGRYDLFLYPAPDFVRRPPR